MCLELSLSSFPAENWHSCQSGESFGFFLVFKYIENYDKSCYRQPSKALTYTQELHFSSAL